MFRTKLYVTPENFTPPLEIMEVWRMEAWRMWGAEWRGLDIGE